MILWKAAGPFVLSGYVFAYALGCGSASDPSAGSPVLIALNGGSMSAAGTTQNAAGVLAVGASGGNAAVGGGIISSNAGKDASAGSGGKSGIGGSAGKSGTSGTAGASGTGGVAGSSAKFGFFVTSFKALQRLSGADKGFGGDLRYGETGNGAGLRGADKICSTIAETSMPGAGSKVWRAFLSATNYDQDGKAGQVNAIDRVGNGPWYDRRGRVFSLTKADLLNTRPASADPLIKNDFPNEDGVCNKDPDGTGAVDNHDMLTGTNTEGKLYSATATCKDWTTADGTYTGNPRVGHSWPRSGGGGPGGDTMGNWMSALDEAGCAPGYYMPVPGSSGDGPPNERDNFVGSGGGYGGFYCFALTP